LKVNTQDLEQLKKANYPIHAELVRKVGFKMGKGFSPIPKRDEATGQELRDEENNIVIDSDFTGIVERFLRFSQMVGWQLPLSEQEQSFPEWKGGTIEDVTNHPHLDLKPRRLAQRALTNIRVLKANKHIRLGDIADVLDETLDLSAVENFQKKWRLVEGIDIRAVEGVVVPQLPARAWQIIERKQRQVYHLQENDVVVGLVRPERRNIGLLLTGGNDLVGSPDGVGIVRLKDDAPKKYTVEWLFASLRSEQSRLQLWTESGGTSYGKLTRQHILEVVLPDESEELLRSTSETVTKWAMKMKDAFDLWANIGNEEDRIPIINSPMLGLEVDD
jgi:type I restriction enzyme M protein